MPLSEYPVGPDVCRKWVTFLVAGVTALFCSLQAVVMIRVYFLYSRSSTAGCLLAAMFATQCGLGMMSCVQNLGRSKFDRSCNMLGTYNESFYFGGTCVGINIMIWFMTLYKKSNHSPREQRLISTLIHQGAYIMALVFAIVLSGVPVSFVTNILRPTLIFLWPQALFSISTCRLILSMYRTSDASEQQTHIEGRGTVTRDPRLSSMFEMAVPAADAVLDLDSEGSRRGSHES
ncbi:hypothetical protein BJ165DRAFT_1041 [Panaeolus papilionaceus]|nr:hypothetical protein BJ165DRAFT_1041 [Panaeolus papilionaceus]